MEHIRKQLAVTPTYELPHKAASLSKHEKGSKYYYYNWLKPEMRVYYHDDLETMERKITIFEKLEGDIVDPEAVNGKVKVWLEGKRKRMLALGHDDEDGELVEIFDAVLSDEE